MESPSLSSSTITDFSPKAAAQMLSISRKSILRLIRTNRLPAYAVGTGIRPRYRIPREALLAFRAQTPDALTAATSLEKENQ